MVKAPPGNCGRRQEQKKTGTWPEVLGYAPDAGHYMYVWHMLNSSMAVAEAGKAVYYLPMFVNLWTPPKWWTLHGAQAIDYVEREILMDLYRWATPHLETIAPDIYTRESRDFERQCDIHTRPDNPLFTTETSGDQNMFRAIASLTPSAITWPVSKISSIRTATFTRPRSILLTTLMRSVGHPFIAQIPGYRQDTPGTRRIRHGQLLAWQP